MTRRVATLALLCVAAALPLAAQTEIEPEQQSPSGFCNNVRVANIAAIDQPYFWNRLGAVQPHGMLYALKRDIVALNGGNSPSAGNARLRDEKRPRPIVLRVNAGDCLRINFTNWLHPVAADNEQVRTRDASARVTGLSLVQGINDDGSWVGLNPGAKGSLAAPGQSKVYNYYAAKEGTYLLYNGGALTGGEGDNGTISAGLFGAVNVEPQGSTWYRSQVTRVDFDRITAGQPVHELEREDTVAGVTWIEQYPEVNYNAVHPAGHPSRPNLPVLNMLSGNEIIYSDLTAIIVPPANAYQFTPAVYPERDEPFREFTIIFHDEPGAVQAFPHFYDKHDNVGVEPEDGLAFTLHSVRDAFGINYGTGGIGAEILANRLGVGPMRQCINCRYEEFFLSSWAVGDPAMVVDIPANSPCDMSSFHDDGTGAPIEGEPGYCDPTVGPLASVALYPEDPSNVYHSYLNDHTKFRNLLVGSDDHHIFHLHAHQWLHSPDGDNSTYKDSQAIGQGTAFTYEIAFEGGGNRNKTPGDSIFHCHFYPHFAQGMWSLWRVHDVLERGTRLDEKGRPLADARALPDGEIARGTPIPGLVPLPGEPMAPPPSVDVFISGGQVQYGSTVAYGNPGYPFWVPGVAGQRVPTPPLDVWFDPVNNMFHDGGLPRHVVVDGKFDQIQSRLDFTKEVKEAVAIELDEDGEPWERAAMRWHADEIDDGVDGFMKTYTPEGFTEAFAINAAPEIPGAPYADPCGEFVIDPHYPPFPREYRAANIQRDVVFNTEGWHFPQQRFLSLWEDVDDYINQNEQPVPLFIRANSGDCVTFLHTNLVPKVYELDDFQVRTPTDILGQHIHLVKFDVTSSDGSANGFNYEDGTLSPEEVVAMIDAINAVGGIFDAPGGSQHTLTAVKHPFFANVPNVQALGAQTTVQRWYVDPILNNLDQNRSLRTIFTHDHFGPSTHQQVGLYAGLLTYKGQSPATQWFDGSTGTQLGTRDDGGPTTWEAVIKGPQENFREFALEFGDFQHAYWPNSTYPDPENAINPPGRIKKWDTLDADPWIYEKPFFVGECPSGGEPPCPEAISADDPGFGVVNYRSEPLALRVVDNPQSSPTLAPAPRGDLSYAFSSLVHGDPDTPILEAYENDPVHMRILVGAHEEEHNFSVHGTRWLFEPSAEDSGYKSSQMMGISEFYDFEVPHLLGSTSPYHDAVDFLYKAGSSNDDLWNGIWGIIRAYKGPRQGVFPVSPGRYGGPDVTETETNAPVPTEGELTTREGSTGLEGVVTAGAGGTTDPGRPFPGVNPASVCPTNSLPAREYSVVAVAASVALPANRLVYNSRNTSLDKCEPVENPYPAFDGVTCTSTGIHGPLVDPDAILFVHATDLNPDGTLKALAPIEPLILRARAGECVVIKLHNRLPDTGTWAADRNGYSLLPNIIDFFNQNQVPPSARVGLHPTLVSYDVLLADGNNVGFNLEQTIAPGQSRKMVWYMGISEVDSSGRIVGTPVEFGSVPLYSSDPIKHSNKAAVGALIVESETAKWVESPRTRAVAKVDPTPGSDNGDAFREFVLVFQDDINLFAEDEEYGDLRPLRPIKIAEDPTETGHAAFNYRTEPVWFRQGFLPQTDPGATRMFDLADTFSNALVGGDPETPLFRAVRGENIRFRIVHPAGDTQQHTWGLHGHEFLEEPWTKQSTVMEFNPLSEFKGVEYGIGPTTGVDAMMTTGAGGARQRVGDFMYRDYVPWHVSNGLWGILRVYGTRGELDSVEPEWNEAEPAPEPSLSPVMQPAPLATPGFDATQPVAMEGSAK